MIIIVSRYANGHPRSGDIAWIVRDRFYVPGKAHAEAARLNSAIAEVDDAVPNVRYYVEHVS